MVALLVGRRTCDSYAAVRVLPRHYCAVTLGKLLTLCASVTKQYNLVPVKGRLPCDWGVQRKLWSVRGWQVKLCDPLVTHRPCLTSRCCPAWQPVVVERLDLTVIKAAYYYARRRTSPCVHVRASIDVRRCTQCERGFKITSVVSVDTANNRIW